MPKFFTLLLLLSSCGIDRTINSISSAEKRDFDSFKKLDQKHKLSIADKSEPGEPLTLCLTFVDKITKAPLVNRQVHFYHTNINGDYRPEIAGDESTARLNGDAISDSNGRILVSTILPGDYGSSTDNRHIHTSFFGAKPEAYDIHFKQYTGIMGKRFIDGSDQHFLADLKKNIDGTLIGFLTIEVKNP
ncbi:hypothetical protein [Ekhidna sp.]|uniref:dioxygenase family protein n=1 Tax=Ekhidna sp. TaxID=2608089 RepID=UPI003B500342